MERKQVIRIYVVLSSAVGDGKLRERLTVYEEQGGPRCQVPHKRYTHQRGSYYRVTAKFPLPPVPCSSFQFLVCFEVPRPKP